MGVHETPGNSVATFGKYSYACAASHGQVETGASTTKLHTSKIATKSLAKCRNSTIGSKCFQNRADEIDYLGSCSRRVHKDLMRGRPCAVASVRRQNPGLVFAMMLPGSPTHLLDSTFHPPPSVIERSLPTALAQIRPWLLTEKPGRSLPHINWLAGEWATERATGQRLTTV